MKLAPEAKLVIQTFVNKYPIPSGNEEAIQNWTHKLSQQLAFTFYGAGWGHKSASINRPHSKDVVCLKDPFIGWDILLGAGTPDPKLSLNGESIDLTGQYFETVVPINFLDDAIPPTPPTDDINAKLDKIIITQAEIIKLINDSVTLLEIQAQNNTENLINEMIRNTDKIISEINIVKPIEVIHPDYVGKFAMNMTFSPKILQK